MTRDQQEIHALRRHLADLQAELFEANRRLKKWPMLGCLAVTQEQYDGDMERLKSAEARVTELEAELKQAKDVVNGNRHNQGVLTGMLQAAHNIACEERGSANENAQKLQARVSELEREHAIRDHQCSNCGAAAVDTVRRKSFGKMRTSCPACGKWWTPTSKHPFNEPEETEG